MYFLMNRRWWLVLLGISALSFTALTKAADPVAEWEGGHLQTLSRFDKYYAEIVAEQTMADGKAGVKYEGQYWHMGNYSRLWCPKTETGYNSEVEWKDGRMLQIADHPTTVQSDPGLITARILLPERKHVDLDAWEWSLFRVPLGLKISENGPVYPFQSLPTFFRSAQNLTSEKRSGPDGPLIVVSAVSPGEGKRCARRVTSWLSASHGYLATKCSVVYSGVPGTPTETYSEMSYDYEVKEWIDLGPGVRAPKEIVSRCSFDGEPFCDWKARLNRIELGKTVPPVRPMPSLANRTLSDEIRGTVSRLGADGKPIQVGSRLGVYNPPAEDKADLLNPPPDLSRSWWGRSWRWVLLAVGVCLLIFIWAALRKRTETGKGS